MKCVEVYKELYHQEPFDVAFCPYRISPLGAHIDHQYGKINGLAIDKGIHMAYHPKQNGVVELQSLNFPKRAQFFVNTYSLFRCCWKQMVWQQEKTISLKEGMMPRKMQLSFRLKKMNKVPSRLKSVQLDITSTWTYNTSKWT